MSQDKGTTYNISPIIKEYPTKEDFFGHIHFIMYVLFQTQNTYSPFGLACPRVFPRMENDGK